MHMMAVKGSGGPVPFGGGGEGAQYAVIQFMAIPVEVLEDE
jgi:hypothetical protein